MEQSENQGSIARRAGRPKDQAKRQAIIDSALRLFCAQRAGQVGLEEVARDAGVSRMTLYSHFGGKASLLTALVEQESERVIAAMNTVRPARCGSLGDRLIVFGRSYLELVTRPDIVAFDRLFAMEAAEHPELRDQFLMAGPNRLKGCLANTLQEQVPNVGDRADDLAGQFMVLLIGDLLLLERYGSPPSLTAAELSDRAEKAVTFFLAALGGIYGFREEP